MTTNRKYCDWIDPVLVAKELIKVFGEEGMIWLDGDGSEFGRWVTLGINPIDHICCYGTPNEKTNSNPFQVLKDLQPGHWTGWLSYEAAAWIEPQNPWREDKMATLWLANHDPVLKFDLHKKELWIEGNNKKRIYTFKKIIQNIQTHNETKQLYSEVLKSKKHKGISINSWKWITSNINFKSNVELIKNLIRTGDLFQANLSTCCQTTIPKNITAVDLYLKLRQNCPAPFGGIIIGKQETSGQAVISSSPERFLKVLPTGEVETRPIKGTRPRHKDEIYDTNLALDLITSEKDRAENTMIVDLMRNDLGKVCKPGSIFVPQLIGLESYKQVHHLTSVIKGSLKSNHTWVNLLEACWPGGSISGAPKLRACQRLYELESIPRGPYCGSFLHINWDGSFDSNILIRSLMVNGRMIRAHAGCGIVADSNSNDETEEMNWKLRPLIEALQ